MHALQAYKSAWAERGLQQVSCSALQQSPAAPEAVGALQFLGMFRAELLDLREIMGFLRMGSSAAVPPGGAAAFQVLHLFLCHPLRRSCASPELPQPCSGCVRFDALPSAQGVWFGAHCSASTLRGCAQNPSNFGGQWRPGEVSMLMSEEEFDAALALHAQRLIVLEASLTWCRPCKGFERSYEVCA